MGTVRGGMRCIKILLFIFNLTFWLAGLAVIAFGLWLRFGGVMADFASDKKSPEYFFMGLYVLVGAGALMTTVGFFGCCGAARESQCLLGAFFACLLVIFAAEVTAGVFAFIGKKVLQCCGKDNMEQMGLPCPENIQMPKNCLVEIQNVIDANLHLVGIVGIAIAGITDWTLHANAESSGGGNMSKEIQAKGRGGKRWEAGKIMQSYGSDCSAKCA
ncbi:tetraspanin-2 isoform X3 [Accipiter gentilis]|uniref:tetraspanin-2 isoform X3 n=1 Tax=Astur gentilis TaxID=8957 RepID=UPI00210FC37D|nr:tetraspanin-2 isoform X3 [Accipiter gentilis]